MSHIQNVAFTGSEQDFMNEATKYWFVVQFAEEQFGITYGVVESGPTSTIVDADGYPVTDREERKLKDVLVVTDEMRETAAA